MGLSFAGFLGIEWFGGVTAGVCLFVLWGFYLSIANVGRLFYGYGWESFLCEAGILAVFLGGAHQEVSHVILYLVAWLLFRVMFGAGLIKIRGDQCWRDFTCMDYHYETQPMPNPLSWFAHHMPSWWHKIEVAGNHFVELAVPFLYFFPQPIAGIAGMITMGFMGWLMLTGNFSWLNFLTAVIAVLLVPDSFFEFLGMAVPVMELELPSIGFQVMMYLYSALVFVLSYYPAKNLLSNHQLMNAGFDPLNLVNTYGAFGSITKHRYELVVEGLDQDGNWRTYEFKGKPTDPERMPPQWAPYHLRLDWQLWFAAMRHRPSHWLSGMIRKLEENDEDFLRLIADNPFQNSEGPRRIRIRRFRYEYSSWQELWNEGRWWNRQYVEDVIR